MTESLISRLQALTEPSREIDALIFERSGMVNEDHCRSWCSMDGRTDLTRKQFIKTWAPRYTESLDAALTLVPADPANPGKPMLWWLNYDEDGVAGPRGYTASLGKGYHDPHYIYGHSDATPAIALLIAIMKAKEESKQ